MKPEPRRFAPSQAAALSRNAWPLSPECARKISDLLQARGYKPKRAATWHPQVVKQVLALHFPGRNSSRRSKKQTTTALKLQ
jgi:hypothetical protein